MRALECSGPWPSKPWGRSSARRDCWPHLSSAATMNWSTMICAPLMKSPNCASQPTHASGSDDRVAVLEAERGVLGEHGVVEHHRRLRRVDVAERAVLGLGVGVDEHAVALAERAPARVLAGEPHRRALERQRAERERLGERPVDLVGVEVGGAGLEDPLELRVDVEVVGRRDERVDDRAQPVARHAGVDRDCSTSSGTTMFTGIVGGPD